MSASTVSITANPGAASRRRPVVVGGEKKSNNIELLMPSESQHFGRIGDDKVTSVGTDKDVSHHSIRGEAVLERSSRDLIQLKKTSTTVSPRRSRKAVTKPEKPRWVTVLSVFSKNFVLLLVVLGLVQLIRKLALKSGDGLEGSPLGISEFEGRIADVEALMKTTAKMMQVQVDVVDRKIEREVGWLKKEVSEQIEDRVVAFEGGFKNLETRTEGLEKSLEKLSSSDLMTKEEFEKVYEELVKKVKSSDNAENDVSLDDLRAYAKDVIQKEIEKHAADGLGRVDYALASGGAAVVKHSEPVLAGKGGSWFPMNNRNGVHSNAVKVLQPSFGEPGQCFALKGSSGFVQIRLRTAIIPEAITLEHVAKSVAYDRSSAPKDSRISGWLQGVDVEAEEDRKMTLLTEFSYDLEKRNAQTFDVAGSGVVDTIRFEFSSNHGSPSHTCIYRLRVHGHEPDSLSMMPVQS